MENTYFSEPQYRPPEPPVLKTVKAKQPWLRIRLIILVVFLGIIGFMVFTKETLPTTPAKPDLSPTPASEKIVCQEPRPQICTLECMVNPPYLCGSDGKSYCTVCDACSHPDVQWYITQTDPCEKMSP